MSNFKVIGIVNATTIKVSPNWTFPKSDGTGLIDDRIKITGLNVADNDARVISRLSSFLIGKEVEAYNPTITVGQVAPIECNIYLAKTDIVYYFPEYHPA